MASTEEINFRVEKLTSENFYNWKFDIKMLLVGKDLWDIVSGDEVLAGDATEAEKNTFRKRDNKALAVICLAISSNIKIYVRSAKTSKEAWDSLCNHFEEKTLLRQINYLSQQLMLSEWGVLATWWNM